MTIDCLLLGCHVVLTVVSLIFHAEEIVIIWPQVDICLENNRTNRQFLIYFEQSQQIRIV